MKKKLVSLVIAGMVIIGCGGCSPHAYETTTSADTNLGGRIGRFIILEDEGKYEDEDSHWHHQYLVYDKDTYIIYIYDLSGNSMSYDGGVAISPFYCMDENNQPQIAIYYDGMEVE